MTAIKIIDNRRLYDASSTDFVISDPRIASASYASVLNHMLHDGQYVEMIHLYAISAALNVAFQSYAPPSPSLGLLDSPYTCVVVGCGVKISAPRFTVMWTSTTVPSDSNEALDINHVVLLAKRSTSSPEQPVNCDTDDYDVEPLQEDDRTCDYLALAADSFAAADPVQDNSEIAPPPTSIRRT